MAYFHIDRTRAYVDSLGLSESLRAKPQRVRANAIPADNSFYSSMTQSMTLGTAGSTTARTPTSSCTSTGIRSRTRRSRAFGRTIATGSMGEGFGDYLAAAMSALVTGGNPASTPASSTGTPVSYSPTGCGRRADRALTLKRAQRRCLLEIHCVGEAWSGLLYELRAALGADTQGQSVMDRVVLESHFMLGKRSSFRDGARP